MIKDIKDHFELLFIVGLVLVGVHFALKKIRGKGLK